jgi:hypothetical protein
MNADRESWLRIDADERNRIHSPRRMGYNGGVGTRMKPIRLTSHACLQCAERGATKEEVARTVREGAREPAKLGRTLCRFNFAFNRTWQGNWYAVKQVAAVIKESAAEIVVITVYTFYF